MSNLKSLNMVEENQNKSFSSAEPKYEQKEDISSRKQTRSKFNIRKADIGLPSEFKHVSHIGWDPNIGFNVRCDDPALSRFIKRDEVHTNNHKEESQNQNKVRKSLSAPSSPNLQKQKQSYANTEIDKFLQKAGSSKISTQNEEQDLVVTMKLKRGHKITKADIGKPSEFRHISHVGWSPNGFDIECNDPHINSVLHKKETEGNQCSTTTDKTRSLSAPPSLLVTSQLENIQMDLLHKYKRRISKGGIGFPFNFRHISHITWDPEKGFNIDCDDPELSAFLKLAGVTDKQLQDKQTRDFICDFINRHGGYEHEAVHKGIRIVSQGTSSPSPELLVATHNQKVID